MGTYQNNFTDATLQATVHAKSHNELASGLMALETRVAGIGTGGGGTSTSTVQDHVDITIYRGATMESHRVTYSGSSSSIMPDMGFYVPRDFGIEYMHAAMEVPPTGPVDVVVIMNDAPLYTCHLTSGTMQAEGTFNIDAEDNRVYKGFSGYSGCYVTLRFNSTVTSLGRDLTVRLGGRALVNGVLPDDPAVTPPPANN